MTLDAAVDEPATGGTAVVPPRRGATQAAAPAVESVGATESTGATPGSGPRADTPLGGTSRRPTSRRSAAQRLATLRRAVRSPAAAGVLLAVLSFAGSLILQHTFFRDGSGDADEAAYLLQARMLLDGRLTLDAAVVEPFFRPWLTGEHDGRIFTKYLPGWPALLAGSQALFGTMTVAPAAAAAAWVAGTYRLARELFGGARTALLAAAGVALSPIVLLHTALPLAYAACVAVLTLASAELLRGSRTGSRAALLGGGAGAGFALLIRPFDAVLVIFPVLALALVRHRSEARGAARRGTAVLTPPRHRVWMVLGGRWAWAALGALPMVAILLAYCWHVTGSPLRMPLSVSDPLDRFGFGPRRILPSEPSFLFTRRLALDALRETLAVAPSWFFGGLGLIALAAVGLLAPRHRPEKLMLLATSGAILAGYTFWWGSAFAMPGLRDGLGPHYHLAAFTPIVILAAAGTSWLWRASRRPASRRPASGRSATGRSVAGKARRALRPGVALLAGVWLVVVTVPTVAPRLDVQRGVNKGNAFLERTIPDQLDGPAVVIVTPPVPSRYTQIPYHTLRNSPDLDGPVVYAADLGPASAALPDRMPDRTVYRLRPGEIIDPTSPDSFGGSFVRLTPVTGTRLRVRVDVEPSARGSGGRLYLRLGSELLTVRNDTTSHSFTVTSSVSSASVASVASSTSGAGRGAVNGSDEIVLPVAALPAELTVGYADGPGTDAAHWEERIPVVARADGELGLLTPGLGWRYLPSTSAGASGWVAATTQPGLRVSLTATSPLPDPSRTR